MKSEELQELLERASRGDREAYGPILKEELRPKSRFKYFPDPAFDGDVLIQETLLKLFLKCGEEGAKWTDKKGKPVKKKSGYFRRMYNFTYWEIRRAGNKSKQSKKQQDEEELSTPFWPEPRPRSEEIADPNSDPAAIAVAKELWGLIWQYNPRNPREKVAAWLRFGCGLSLVEIAETMGVKLNTVKSLVCRWRKGLKEFLKLRGYGRYFRS